MKFSIYGRFLLEVQRENSVWTVYRLGVGKRSKATDIVLPPDLSEGELAVFLDDLFHELAQPGEIVELVE